MRITGGVWASRRLIGPRARQPVRPTTDALRERAFAVLEPAVRGGAVLDLFAGTGSVGFEALSRGAGTVVFVDSHRSAERLIARNAEVLDVDRARWRVLRRTAAAAVRQLQGEGAVFDLVWADPPFDRWKLGLGALAAVAEAGLLERGGRACLELPAAVDAGAHLPQSLDIVREIPSSAVRLAILALSAGGKRPEAGDRRPGGERRARQ